MFDGAKAELQKSISLAPMFQINHAFSLGGQSPGAPGPSPGNYNFAAVVVNDDVLRPLDQVCFIEGTSAARSECCDSALPKRQWKAAEVSLV